MASRACAVGLLLGSWTRYPGLLGTYSTGRVAVAMHGLTAGSSSPCDRRGSTVAPSAPRASLTTRTSATTRRPRKRPKPAIGRACAAAPRPPRDRPLGEEPPRSCSAHCGSFRMARSITARWPISPIDSASAFDTSVGCLPSMSGHPPRRSRRHGGYNSRNGYWMTPTCRSRTLLLPPGSEASAASTMFSWRPTDVRRAGCAKAGAAAPKQARYAEIYTAAGISPSVRLGPLAAFLRRSRFRASEAVTAGSYARAVWTPSGHAAAADSARGACPRLGGSSSRGDARGVAAIACVSSANVRPYRRSRPYNVDPGRRSIAGAPDRTPTGATDPWRLGSLRMCSGGDRCAAGRHGRAYPIAEAIGRAIRQADRAPRAGRALSLPHSRGSGGGRCGCAAEQP